MNRCKLHNILTIVMLAMLSIAGTGQLAYGAQEAPDVIPEGVRPELSFGQQCINTVSEYVVDPIATIFPHLYREAYHYQLAGAGQQSAKPHYKISELITHNWVKYEQDNTGKYYIPMRALEPQKSDHGNLELRDNFAVNQRTSDVYYRAGNGDWRPLYGYKASSVVTSPDHQKVIFHDGVLIRLVRRAKDNELNFFEYHTDRQLLIRPGYVQVASDPDRQNVTDEPYFYGPFSNEPTSRPFYFSKGGPTVDPYGNLLCIERDPAHSDMCYVVSYDRSGTKVRWLTYRCDPQAGDDLSPDLRSIKQYNFLRDCSNRVCLQPNRVRLMLASLFYGPLLAGIALYKKLVARKKNAEKTNTPEKTQNADNKPTNDEANKDAGVAAAPAIDPKSPTQNAKASTQASSKPSLPKDSLAITDKNTNQKSSTPPSIKTRIINRLSRVFSRLRPT